MPYNFVPDSFQTGVTAGALRAKIDWKSAILHQSGHFYQKFQVQGVAPPIILADFLQAKCNFFAEIGRFAFTDPLWGRGATYEGHLRLIVNRIVDFLLALIELFFPRCYDWGATSNYWLKIGEFAPTGAGWPEIVRRRGQPFFVSENYERCTVRMV